MTLLTPKQAASILFVSSQTLRRWEEEGKITSQRTNGGHRRYVAEEVEQLRLLNQTGSKQEPLEEENKISDIASKQTEAEISWLWVTGLFALIYVALFIGSLFANSLIQIPISMSSFFLIAMAFILTSSMTTMTNRRRSIIVITAFAVVVGSISIFMGASGSGKGERAFKQTTPVLSSMRDKALTNAKCQASKSKIADDSQDTIDYSADQIRLDAEPFINPGTQKATILENTKGWLDAMVSKYNQYCY